METLFGEWKGLDEVIFLQVQLQNGVLYSGENKTDVFRVGGTGNVRIDHFLGVWIQLHKHLQYELTRRFCVSLRTYKGYK